MSTEASSTATTEVKYRTLDIERPKQFRHWVRPRSNVYSYLYDYHRNYYDDMIDYLDRRRRGIAGEIPRPQTWAERAFRTYTQRLNVEKELKAHQDVELVSKVHRSATTTTTTTQEHQSKDYSAKRFTTTVY